MQYLFFTISILYLFGNVVHGRTSPFDPIIQLPTVEKISVVDFGAIGDGISDDTEAFNKAWKETCFSPREVVLEIPRGRVYVVEKALSFSGPCKSQITVEISGDIRSAYDEDQRLIRFEKVDNLMVKGRGNLISNGGLVFYDDSSNNLDVKLHAPM